MDVGPTMKSIAFPFALITSVSSSFAQDVRVFDVQLIVRDSCEVLFSRNGMESRNLHLDSPNSEKCRLLFHGETNIPRIELISGEYVLIVEQFSNVKGECRARLAGITITREGRVRISPKTQSTSACGSGERKDFEILRSRTPK